MKGKVPCSGTAIKLAMSSAIFVFSMSVHLYAGSEDVQERINNLMEANPWKEAVVSGTMSARFGSISEEMKKAAIAATNKQIQGFQTNIADPKLRDLNISTAKSGLARILQHQSTASSYTLETESTFALAIASDGFGWKVAETGQKGELVIRTSNGQVDLGYVDPSKPSGMPSIQRSGDPGATCYDEIPLLLDFKQACQSYENSELSAGTDYCTVTLSGVRAEPGGPRLPYQALAFCFASPFSSGPVSVEVRTAGQNPKIVKRLTITPQNPSRDPCIGNLDFAIYRPDGTIHAISQLTITNAERKPNLLLADFIQWPVGAIITDSRFNREKPSQYRQTFGEPGDRTFK